MQPNHEQVALSEVEILQRACDQFNDELREFLQSESRPMQYGWKRTKLSHDQLDYIQSRMRLMDAIRAVQAIDPKFYAYSTHETTMKIRENTLHALATMSRAMVAREDTYLWPKE